MRYFVLSIFLLISLNLYSELPVPPVIDIDNLNLNIQMGELKLPSGTSKTMGYNGDYLGPTIRVRNGDFLKFNISNNLDDNTTVHWHGLHVPAEYDGGPYQVIKKGDTWNPEFKIDQNAATLWYHPHLMGKTAEHVYNGLAVMFYIEDSYSDSLNIPKEYGINDFPLVLQDRRVDSRGKFNYRPSMHDEMMGYIGNTMLTNGAVNPEQNLDPGTYRYRIVNGSNSSIYRIRFSDDREFTVIGSDGGFLPETTERTSIIVSPGERYEILVDINKNEEISLYTDIYNGPSFESLKIVSNNRNGIFYNHPNKLKYAPVEYSENNLKREFNMETRGMSGFTINGKQMDLKRVDFSLNRNTTEVWTIRNVSRGMMMRTPHSFHVHDVQFTVISVDGKQPDELYKGPKDTVLLMPGQEIKIALTFQDYTGLYMYHCHFLEHEDNGMMGQFEILP